MTEKTTQPHKQADKKQPKKPRVVELKTVILVSVLIAATFFVLGTRGDSWLSYLRSNSQNQNLPAQLNFNELNKVYALLRERYDGQLDQQKLLDGAKKGLVEATGDPYTTYFTDAEAREFFGDLDGKFSGIGAELGKRNDQLTVISTIDNSPAAKSGVKPGDIIGKVNDEEVTGWSVEQAVSKIRGEKGTTVKLSVARGDEVKNFDITRDDIVDPSVRSETLDGNIGYIRLSRFNDSDSAALTRQAAEKFKQDGVKGVILDLRGNGGGYVDAAKQIASIWLEKDTVVVEERQGNKVLDSVKTDGAPILNGVPLVVLVDSYSASASEIIAGAFKDYGTAKLVGEKTYGKGSVQTIEEVSGGGQLKVTIAKWYTPNGKNINKEGIEPDEKVEFSPEAANQGKDPQRDKAIELLQQQ